MIGSVAGSYRIVDVLSVGGMGTVYRAEHTLIGRMAAVKVLHPEMSASTDIINRFFNEARATTSIKHPGIVEVYDFGYLESGHAYLVMEFLDGRTLNARNKQRGPVPEAEAAALLRAVCGPLSAAHGLGIVHRDLKPDNIFLVPDPDSELGERPKLLDFGIAKLTDIGLASSATKTGALMGTPTYMSPEQCRGTGDVDHRADIYSLGCIFYEMVTGRPPFTERGAGELIAAHLFMDPPRPSDLVSIAPDADALIMAMLDKHASQRPQTVIDLALLLGDIASRGGFTSSTSWERPSMPLMAGDQPARASRPSLRQITPMPGHLRPTITPGSTPMPAFSAEKPTTLSGAASHSIARSPARSRSLIVVAGLAIAGGAIALVVAVGSGKGEGGRAAARGTSLPAHGSDAGIPTAGSPTAVASPTASPTTASPTTASPTTASPTTASPTTASPTTATASPTTTPTGAKLTSVAKPTPVAKPARSKKPKTTTGSTTSEPLLETDL